MAERAARSDHAIGKHGVGNLDEAGDVGPLRIDYVAVALPAVLDSLVVAAPHGVAKQFLQFILGSPVTCRSSFTAAALIAVIIPISSTNSIL